MTIPESKLSIWTNQGSVVNSSKTHNILRNALSRYSWSNLIKYTDYLQGSYANTTNIRGESDVDIVIECTSIFFNNLEENERRILGLIPGSHTFGDFREEVIDALVNYYGEEYVDKSGSNAVKVLPSETNTRLYADVIICASYKHYESRKVWAEGITFWKNNGEQVINFPKRHRANGALKNRRTREYYKKIVRMFKNARRCMTQRDADLKKKFPSYFVECLIYNVPDKYFLGGSWQEDFVNILNYLLSVIDTDAIEDFTTQSGLHYLIGESSVQWARKDAREFVYALLELWNNYYERN